LRAEDLTVVIPTSGRWEILKRTLAALADQTESGFETIVVGDGIEQQTPASVQAARLIVQQQAGPGVARNLGARESRRELVLFLGDDIVPTPALVGSHLDRHRREPAPEVAVLGHVEWHPDVERSRLLRWLEWSGAQFDYRQLAREGGDEAGFGRFYSCNVSLKRKFFLDSGGFDPDFRFDYEDLDLGWRLDQRGMRLRYEPRAVGQHLHRYDWPSIERRYASRARAELLMMSKHDWFSPWFYNQVSWHAQQRGVSRVWPFVVDFVPERSGRLRRFVEAKADRRYQQRLAPVFLKAWREARAAKTLGEPSPLTPR
jgi:GT2 family glycosyltransferase